MGRGVADTASFSALQRAEIAEIVSDRIERRLTSSGFSALQRAEIAEIKFQAVAGDSLSSFSALQRAEIAEILRAANPIS